MAINIYSTLPGTLKDFTNTMFKRKWERKRKFERKLFDLLLENMLTLPC